MTCAIVRPSLYAGMTIDSIIFDDEAEHAAGAILVAATVWSLVDLIEPGVTEVAFATTRLCTPTSSRVTGDFAGERETERHS